MHTFRLNLAALIIATCAIGTLAVGRMEKKTIDTADTELRLMAMLFVSVTTPH